eukprot:COSAG06_NODE_17935_length_913_cov_1.431204_1_plen_51_part_01
MDADWCDKRVSILCHLIIKTVILSRQARDKHRESTQKEMMCCVRRDEDNWD